MKLVWVLGMGALLGGIEPVAGQAPGPNKALDSLETAIHQHTRPDTVRVGRLLETAERLRGGDPAGASQLTAEALRLAQQLHFAAGELRAYRGQGTLGTMMGKFGEADAANGQALRLARRAGDSTSVAMVLHTLGIGAAMRGEYERSIALDLRALAIFDRTSNAAAQAKVLGGVAMLLLNIDRPRPALGYYERLLRLATQTHNPYDQALALAGMGISHQQLNEFKQAEAYLLRALPLARQSGNPELLNSVFSNLGFLRLKQHQPAAAVKLLDDALALVRGAHGPPRQVAALQNARASALLQLHDYAAAETASREVLALSQPVNGRREMADAYGNLAAVYSHNGEYARAYASQLQLQGLRDSLYSVQSARQITELQTQYETEKKESQNRLQAAQLRTQQQIIRRRNVQLLAGVVVALLLAGLAYLLYHRRRLRREVEFAHERQQLSQLRAQAVLEAEETERRRIGSDLHDGVGQLLTAAKLNLHALGEELNVQTLGQQTLLQNALDVVDESFREVRSISHNLMPNALIKRGLAQAVRDFLDKITPDGRLKINLEVVGLDRGGRLEPTVENVLFRVIQELVQNILKHAQATEVTLQIIRHPEELTVLVEDNGVGFDPAALGEDAGIGLKNIESRMAYLGGRADFDAASGRGTTVTLEIPLAAVAG